MEFNPLPKKILISPIEEKTQSESGIITSTKKDTKYSLGVCIRVGENCGCLKEGQTIAFNPRSANKFEEYLILDYEAVIGILEE